MTDRTIAPRPTRFDPLPPQPPGVPWPVPAFARRTPDADVAPDLRDQMTRGFAPEHIELPTRDPARPPVITDPAGRDGRVETEITDNLALLIVHRGTVVAEAYGPTAGPQTTLISWSMAKSITHCLIGLLCRDGVIDLDDRVPVAQWQDPGDPRGEITLSELLTMTSGLSFVEDYVDAGVSDVIEMLFGAGQHDVAGFAASQPLRHPPGTVHSYASGTTNIITAIAAQRLAEAAGITAPTAAQRRTLVEEYLQRNLFDAIAMASATAKFDTAGTFIGSSFVYATAEDFARFGYLYLRDGIWDGQRILPDGWVDHARRPVAVEVEADHHYGAHWWLWDDRTGAFACHGYEGQMIIVVPARDLVVVRLGKSDAEAVPAVRQWLHDIIMCFPEAELSP